MSRKASDLKRKCDQPSTSECKDDESETSDSLPPEYKKMMSNHSALSDILSEIKKNPGSVMSDEQLEQLFSALCCDTGKRWDSDDSIISDIDHLTKEEIDAKDLGNPFSQPLISSKQLKDILEVMAELTPPDEVTRNGIKNFTATVNAIDSKEVEEKLKYNNIKCHFFSDKMSAVDYLKRKICKILKDDKIRDVIDSNRFGFKFSTKEK
uniref:Phosphoprotein n=1 Tax=Caenorhabditis tropicalis TaxID=1561998 RepID=A0A1I7UEU1_9PELO